MGWNARRDIYSSVAASGITSETYNVEGFQDGFTLQILGSPSTTTVRGSNDDGRTAAITNWSTLTTFIGAGLIVIEPGFRWLQCQRSETTNVVIGGWQRSS